MAGDLGLLFGPFLPPWGGRLVFRLRCRVGCHHGFLGRSRKIRTVPDKMAQAVAIETRHFTNGRRGRKKGAFSGGRLEYNCCTCEGIIALSVAGLSPYACGRHDAWLCSIDLMSLTDWLSWSPKLLSTDARSAVSAGKLVATVGTCAAAGGVAPHRFPPIASRSRILVMNAFKFAGGFASKLALSSG